MKNLKLIMTFIVKDIFVISAVNVEITTLTSDFVIIIKIRILT